MRNRYYNRLFVFEACIGLFFCVFCNHALVAQRIRSITTQDGLSQGYISAIVEGRDGYIWATTLNGLDRFDGENFKSCRHNPSDSFSLASNTVTGLEKDPDGNLWVISQIGIQVYDEFTGHFITPIIGKNGHDEFSFRDQIIFDAKKQLWLYKDTRIQVFQVIDSGKGITRSITLKCVHQYDIDSNNIGDIISILPRKADIVIGTSHQKLYTIAQETGVVAEYPVKPGGPICRIWDDPDSGEIWVQMAEEALLTDGLNCRRFPVKTIKPFSNCTGLSVNHQTLLFGLNTVYAWDGSTLKQLHIDIPEEIISACADHQGNLWIGTNAQGIRYVEVQGYQFPVIQKGQSSTHPVVEDKAKNIWVFVPLVNSGDKGHYRKLLRDGSLGELLTHEAVRWMDVDSDGRYWVILHNKKCAYTERPGGPVTPWPVKAVEGRALQVLCHAGHELWMTSDAYGLIRINTLTREEQFIRLDYPQLDISSINVEIFKTTVVADLQKRIWTGLTFCVWGLEWDPGSNQYRSIFLRKESPQIDIKGNAVLAILPDEKDPNILWTGGPDGLTRWDIHNRTYTLLSGKDGLPDDFIYSIVSDNTGNLWLGTNKGLIEFNPITNQCRLFSTHDGIPAAEFNTSASLKTSDNDIYMNTVGGITWFNPAQLKRQYPPSKMLITNFLVNGVPQPIGLDSVFQFEYRYDQNSLIIDFALLNFIKPQENRYEYRMIGADNVWIQLGNKNNVAYPQLAPGDYTFQVRGISSYGEISDPVTVQFTIRPPWWETWWALVLYALLAAGVMFTIIRAWIRYERIRSALALKEQAAAAEQFRVRLLSNITHEIRTPLTLILGLADQLKRRLTGEDLEKINLLFKSGEDLQHLSNQVLDLSKKGDTRIALQPRDGNLSDFVRHIADYFQYLAAIKSLELEVKLPDEAVWARYDEQALKSILTNLLSNAVKFTPTGGKVILTLQVTDNAFLLFRVTDTGTGMTKAVAERVFERFYQAEGPQKSGGSGIGLSYVKELTERMNGVITVESEPGTGSVFTVTLPYEACLPLAGHSGEAVASYGNTVADDEDTGLPMVLIVEDNPAVAQYISNCLSGKYTTVYAPDGQQGFILAMEHIPDLIVTDVMMPVTDGLEFCQMIKNEPFTCHIPVIMATALVAKTDTIDGLRSGADAYINKPFLQEELLLLAGNLLSLRAAQQQFVARQLQQGALPAEAHRAESRVGEAAESQVGIAVKDTMFLQEVMRLIEENFSNSEYSIVNLQRDIGMSRTQLHRKLTSLTGNPAVYYLKQRRLREGQRLLREHPEMNITEIAYACGFNNANYFSTAFSAAFGVSPRQVR